MRQVEDPHKRFTRLAKVWKRVFDSLTGGEAHDGTTAADVLAGRSPAAVIGVDPMRGDHFTSMVVAAGYLPKAPTPTQGTRPR